MLPCIFKCTLKLFSYTTSDVVLTYLVSILYSYIALKIGSRLESVIPNMTGSFASVIFIGTHMCVCVCFIVDPVLL